MSRRTMCNAKAKENMMSHGNETKTTISNPSSCGCSADCRCGSNCTCKTDRCANGCTCGK